ncbi:MAG: TRZ/ATZ family protein [Clostridiales bacterium]|nr:TRZ/ATZ family protein [Clostridiales bacterium]
MSNKQLKLPLTSKQIQTLVVSEVVSLNGTVYTARDQAHKRMAYAIEHGEQLPFALDGAAIYYCGPTPAPEGKPIGSCGPTTSGRMDKVTPLLIENGLKVMIGKGVRNAAVTQAIKDNGAVYFSAIGGAAALYQSRVKSCELVAYPDLGCEAVYKLEVTDFPVIVSIK